MKKYISIIIALMFFVEGFAQGGNSKKILILDSYTTDVLWADSFVDSLTEYIYNYDPSLSVYTGTLDSDIDPSEYSLKRKFTDIIQGIITDDNIKDFSAIVTIGEEAEYILNKYGFYKIAGRVPVIYAGVCDSVNIKDSSLPPDFYKYFNNAALGKSFRIKFGIPLEKNMDLIFSFFPKTSEIIWIDSPSIRNDYCRNLVSEYLDKRKIELKRLDMDSGHAEKSVSALLAERKHNAVILTYSWNFHSPYIPYTAQKITDSLSRYVNIPMFSIAGSSMMNKFVIGGYNLSSMFGAKKAIDKLKVILDNTDNGEAKSESVANGDYILNYYAVANFGVKETAKKIFGTIYINRNKNFLQKNRIAAGILLFLVLAALIYLIKLISSLLASSKINRYIEEKKKKYESLKATVSSSNFNFGIFNAMGIKQFQLIDPDNPEMGKVFDIIFPDNIYESMLLSQEDIKSIKSKDTIEKEFNLSDLKPFANISSENNRLMHCIIKPIQYFETANYKFMTILSDISSITSNRVYKNKIRHILDYAEKYTNIGIAIYAPVSFEGLATDQWYENFSEHRPESGLLPEYTHLDQDDKKQIAEFRKKVSAGEATYFCRDINISDDTTGMNNWIRQIIISYGEEKEGKKILDMNYNINSEKIQNEKLLLKRNKAEETLKDGERFVSAINHEIRTPLTSIVGFSKILTSSTGAEEKVEIANIIKRNNVQLIELINNIFTLSRLDSLSYTAEKSDVNLNELFEDLKSSTEHMLATSSSSVKKDIKVITEVPTPPVILNTELWNLRKVLTNLISNAIKFTDSGSITFGYQKQETGIYFFVKDTGTGISPQDQTRIFKRFEKVNPYGKPGSGLGLSIAKSIVNRLNGNIGVISREGEGSTFWFTLYDR
ncbi:MAG: HAMP domain-containing histidine kinase [Bacteroidales bacterium]|jgi:signal transduction histidine kinase|nr:HAMP domain-containing histidine kinase [Bacteroidales bacterium]